MVKHYDFHRDSVFSTKGSFGWAGGLDRKDFSSDHDHMSNGISMRTKQKQKRPPLSEAPQKQDTRL